MISLFRPPLAEGLTVRVVGWASQNFKNECPKPASSLSRAGMNVQGCPILRQVVCYSPCTTHR